jgi:hypothetical protein
LTNHCARQFAITELANNPHVNAVEVARVARHRSLQAQSYYIKPTNHSDMARINALSGSLRIPTEEIARLARHRPSARDAEYAEAVNDGTRGSKASKNSGEQNSNTDKSD